MNGDPMRTCDVQVGSGLGSFDGIEPECIRTLLAQILTICTPTHTHTHTVVRIGFEQEVYPAFENVTAMICARLLPDSPSLDREVVVTIRSSDGTATGK